ncbi:hypothetical protein scyTo_0015525 [Scyliorhinus torazame]|uniref:Cadherin domain-containing protein n=1 Tax=Scyliorhinus torazame TaxID=75743 RepID=A0A401PU58_SCYTO|nr:hypothetical protein [Scyliorhinus torazame]
MMPARILLVSYRRFTASLPLRKEPGSATGIYALVLFSTIDLCGVEAKHSVVLHREKRRWISGTFQLREEDPGPFPKEAVKVFNDKSQNHTVTFSLQGEGVDTEPEKGLFSIDRYTGQINVNRKVDREKTKQFLVQNIFIRVFKIAVSLCNLKHLC